MEKSEKKSMELYPLLVPSKNLRKLFEVGVFCVNNRNGEVIKMLEKNLDDTVFVNDAGEKFYFTIKECLQFLDFIFYCGETSDPNPEVFFKIGGQYVLASPNDILGDNIDEVHFVSVYPKNLGLIIDNEGKVSKMTIVDVENSLENKKILVELEEIEIGGADISNMICIVEMPKLLEGKAVFCI